MKTCAVLPKECTLSEVLLKHVILKPPEDKNCYFNYDTEKATREWYRQNLNPEHQGLRPGVHK